MAGTYLAAITWAPVAALEWCCATLVPARRAAVRRAARLLPLELRATLSALAAGWSRPDA